MFNPNPRTQPQDPRPLAITSDPKPPDPRPLALAPNSRTGGHLRRGRRSPFTLHTSPCNTSDWVGGTTSGSFPTRNPQPLAPYPRAPQAKANSSAAENKTAANPASSAKSTTGVENNKRQKTVTLHPTHLTSTPLDASPRDSPPPGTQVRTRSMSADRWCQDLRSRGDEP